MGMRQPAVARLLDQADRAFRAGDLAGAGDAARQVCEIDPDEQSAWLLLADIARRAGEAKDLAVALGRAATLSSDPRSVAALSVDRGWALYSAGQTGQAAEAALGIDQAALPPERLAVLGGLLDATGLSGQAEAPLLRAAAAYPSNAGAWLQLALLRWALGDSDGMLQACGRAIALAPDLAQAHALLAGGRRWSVEDNHVDRLRDLLARATEPLDQARLAYALFKELDDLDDVGPAWRALEQGARAARSVFPWSAARQSEALKRLQAVAGARTNQPQTTSGPSAPRSIFVVGLPRSGTTLVDRVLAAHSQVRSLGELNTFGQLADNGRGPRPRLYADLNTVERLQGADWSSVGTRYRDEVRRLAPSKAVTIDKNPQNWMFAGAIARALPDAIIVHVSRSPMDSLFGAYKQLFIHEHAWSYSLDNLAAHELQHRTGVAYWRERLGQRWVEVSYEDLARRPQVVAPLLLQACGLPFEVACLHPEQAGGVVRTLSSLQVREPINTRSIGGWRRYEAGLEPLRRRLELQGGLAKEPAERG